MSLDTYLFIDRETAYVYVRSSSSVYGGFSEESLRGQEPDYQGKDYKDAVRWASKYEPVEYGIYTGTLCSGCEREVEQEKDHYPLCYWCTLFKQTGEKMNKKDAEILNKLEQEVRPYLP